MAFSGKATCPVCGAVDVGVAPVEGCRLRFAEHRRAPKPGERAPLVPHGGALDWCQASGRWVGETLEHELRKAKVSGD